MMRWTSVGPIVLAGILLSQAAVRAQGGDAHGPVSIERIRKALEEPPPRLRLPGPNGDVPTFRTEVHARLYMLEPLDEAPFDPTYGLPSIGQLLTGGIAKLGSAAVAYKRARAKRRAKQEVQDALAAFCAVHDCPAPDGK